MTPGLRSPLPMSRYGFRTACVLPSTQVVERQAQVYPGTPTFRDAYMHPRGETTLLHTLLAVRDMERPIITVRGGVARPLPSFGLRGLTQNSNAAHQGATGGQSSTAPICTQASRDFNPHRTKQRTFPAQTCSKLGQAWWEHAIESRNPSAPSAHPSGTTRSGVCVATLAAQRRGYHSTILQKYGGSRTTSNAKDGHKGAYLGV
jgi:hypothetical protein